MKLQIIKIFIFAIAFLAHGENIQWRKMTFESKAEGLSFSIQTCHPTIINDAEKGRVWDGKISPVYIPGPDLNESMGGWMWGNCSIETLLYSYSITEKGGDAFKANDAGYSFKVYLDYFDLNRPSYTGFIEKKDFTKLVELLIKDINSQKKRTSSEAENSRINYPDFNKHLNDKLIKLQD